MLLEGVKTIDSFNPAGRKVLLRVDVNSPIDRNTLGIENTAKVKAATVTLKELLSKGATVVLLAHQGRPGDYDFTSLAAHCEVMKESIGSDIGFVEDTCGDRALAAIRNMKKGSALLLENVRKLDYEQKKGTATEHANTELVRNLSPLFDYFVNDAFAAVHRAHCSMVGFTATLPSSAGRLMENELRHLSPLIDNPSRPTSYVFGGKKFGDFLPTLKSVEGSSHVDHILLTGLLAVSFLMSKGTKVDEATASAIRSEADEAFFQEAAALLNSSSKIVLPADMGFEVGGRREDLPVARWPAEGRALDIGSKTIESYAEIISGSHTVFISGPAGVYERSEYEPGTRRIFEAATRGGIYSVIGGGHTSAAAQKLGFDGKVSYMSTGGGALEALISGKKLAVLDSLRESGVKFAARFT